MSMPERAAIAAGSIAAPDTSNGEFSASVMARTPDATSRPKSRTVRALGGAGRTLTVTSVIAPSVPSDPQKILGRS
jgi:hypothetical protein